MHSFQGKDECAYLKYVIESAAEESEAIGKKSQSLEVLHLFRLIAGNQPVDDLIQLSIQDGAQLI